MTLEKDFLSDLYPPLPSVHTVQITAVTTNGPMKIRVYQLLFHTLGIDYVRELPPSPLANRWILTAFCPYYNFLRAAPVLGKTATTAARVLMREIFLSFGFPNILQILLIKQVFSSKSPLVTGHV